MTQADNKYTINRCKTVPEQTSFTNISSDKAITLFRNEVYRYFEAYGRNLPWRKTTDPYDIYISEIMLQQTQVPRVAEKFPSFITRFPDMKSIDDADFKDVLKEWRGLGYNRRALMLKKAAGEITGKFGGIIPDSVDDLVSLPGIGHATAAAILAYAFNQPVVYIETNIRAVFIHHFFAERESVADKEILPIVECALDKNNPRRWYSALMDYGVMLKAQYGNPARRSKHHARQSEFEGSDRQIRGEILGHLANVSATTIAAFSHEHKREMERVARIMDDLLREGFIKQNGDSFSIA